MGSSIPVGFDELMGLGDNPPIAGRDRESRQRWLGQVGQLRERAFACMFQRRGSVNISNELLGSHRAAQQIVRGIEHLPAFGLEPDMPLPAVLFGMGKSGTDQIVERAADRHCRVVQLRRYEGWSCRGLVEPQEAMEQYRLSRPARGRLCGAAWACGNVRASPSRGQGCRAACRARRTEPPVR